MKVCFVSCIDTMDDSRVTRLLRSIHPLTSECHVIMTEGKALVSDPKVEYHPLPGIPGKLVNHSSLRHLAGVFWVRTRNMLTAFRLLWKTRPDVCHCQEPDSWLLGILLKIFRKSRLVVDLREIYEERNQAFPAFCQKMVRFAIRFAMKTFSRWTDCMIHVSDNRAALYADFPSRSLVVRLYPPLNAGSPVPSPLRRDRIFAGRFVLVHGGPLRVNYAANHLMRAVQMAGTSVPGLLLVVLGGIVPSPAMDMKSRSKLEKGGHMVVIPKCSNDKVFDYLRQSDVGICLVVPVNRIYKLAFPRKLFEYLSTGLPVIGSDSPDITATIQGNQCGVVVENLNPERIARAIIRLAADRKGLKKMAENSKRAYRQKYNWQKEEKKLVDLYRGLHPGGK